LRPQLKRKRFERRVRIAANRPAMLEFTRFYWDVVGAEKKKCSGEIYVYLHAIYFSVKYRVDRW
jgi:hypothetical protein